MGLRVPHLRYIRRSLSTLVGSRRRRLIDWLSSVSTALNGTGTSRTFTTDFATDNRLDVTGHGYTTGSGPFSVTTSDTLPSGLDDQALYWVNVVSVNEVTIHITRQDSLSGTNEVAVTDDGTGTHTITPSTSNTAILDKLKQGYTGNAVTGETDIDNLI